MAKPPIVVLSCPVLSLRAAPRCPRPPTRAATATSGAASMRRAARPWRRVVAAVFAAVACRAIRDDDQVRRCLVDPASPCEHTCDRPNGFTRECLDARVPWRTPYHRVRCCLGCCFEHWVERLRVEENRARNAAGDGRLEDGREMIAGFGLESTMAYGSAASDANTTGTATSRDASEERRRRDARRLPRYAALRKDLKATGSLRGKELEDLWSDEKAAPGGVAPAWSRTSWVQAAFGDGCQSFAGYPFGDARRKHLEQLAQDVASKHRVAIATSDDCDAPDAAAATALLKHPNVTTWSARPRLNRALTDASTKRYRPGSRRRRGRRADTGRGGAAGAAWIVRGPSPRDDA